jgi:predicted small integral membrane protein
MGRLIKAVLVLAVLGFAALVVYAYVGDLAPDQREVTKPVVLNGS